MNGVGGGVWIANDIELSELPRSAAFLKSMNENKKRKKNTMYLRIVYLINAYINHTYLPISTRTRQPLFDFGP